MQHKLSITEDLLGKMFNLQNKIDRLEKPNSKIQKKLETDLEKLETMFSIDGIPTKSELQQSIDDIHNNSNFSELESSLELFMILSHCY
jgi:hypothetical protein